MDPVKLGGVRALAEELMEMELAEHIGAERHERTAERTGSRERPSDTRVGTIELKVPRVRDGSFLSESAGTATSY